VAFDEELAFRIRALLDEEQGGVTERRMFGGLAFLLDGNMAVAASSRGGMMVRLDPAVAEVLLEEDGVTAFEMRGKPIAGWLRVAPGAIEEDNDLRRWIGRSAEFVRSLPPK
jgi:TfoX/Sxy family transcriptional regulator of competence genes